MLMKKLKEHCIACRVMANSGDARFGMKGLELVWICNMFELKWIDMNQINLMHQCESTSIYELTCKNMTNELIHDNLVDLNIAWSELPTALYHLSCFTPWSENASPGHRLRCYFPHEKHGDILECQNHHPIICGENPNSITKRLPFYFKV